MIWVKNTSFLFCGDGVEVFLVNGKVKKEAKQWRAVKKGQQVGKKKKKKVKMKMKIQTFFGIEFLSEVKNNRTI